MDRMEVLLANCVAEIRAGRSTLSQCLDRYTSRRGELEPLLTIALSIRKPPELTLDSSYKQAARARLLQEIRSGRQRQPRPVAASPAWSLRPAWARVAAAVLVGVIVVSMLTAGTAYAAQDSLPGELLYPVKIGTEDARLWTAGDGPAGLELNLAFAQNRLAEMGKLAAGDEARAQLALDGYRARLAAALEKARVAADAPLLSGLLETASRDMRNQVLVCDDLVDADTMPPGLVREAGTLAVTEQAAFLGMLAQYDPMRAARMGLDAMASRLLRAQGRANERQYRAMEQALLQYRGYSEMGEEVLRGAQGAGSQGADVERLVSQTLTGQLDALDRIAGQVPQEYAGAVESCRQMMLGLETQARYMYQWRGSPAGPLGPPPQGGGSGAAPQQDGGSGAGGSPGTEGQGPSTPASGGAGGSGTSGGGTGSGTDPRPGAGGSPAPGPGPAPSPDTGGGDGGGTGGSGSGGGEGPNPGTGEGGDGGGGGGGGGSGVPDPGSGEGGSGGGGGGGSGGGR